jgi:hypothetical protein
MHLGVVAVAVLDDDLRLADAAEADRANGGHLSRALSL